MGVAVYRPGEVGDGAGHGGGAGLLVELVGGGQHLGAAGHCTAHSIALATGPRPRVCMHKSSA